MQLTELMHIMFAKESNGMDLESNLCTVILTKKSYFYINFVIGNYQYIRNVMFLKSHKG